MILGLKVWSKNVNYIEPAKALFKKGIFDYIELFIEPGSIQYLERWKLLDIPFILHAPHSSTGFNPSIKELQTSNFSLLNDLELFRLELNPEFIIFHPGVNGTVHETVRQFRKIRNKFPAIGKCALIENKPAIGLNGGHCVGSTYKEIDMIMKEANMGFCFDIGHGIAAGNSTHINIYTLINAFLDLNPQMFHLSDGYIDSEQDAHLNFGHGTYDITRILKTLHSNVMITLETYKISNENLDDFARDVEYVIKIINP